jgi:hypothetical protein
MSEDKNKIDNLANRINISNDEEDLFDNIFNDIENPRQLYTKLQERRDAIIDILEFSESETEIEKSNDNITNDDVIIDILDIDNMDIDIDSKTENINISKSNKRNGSYDDFDINLKKNYVLYKRPLLHKRRPPIRKILKPFTYPQKVSNSSTSNTTNTNNDIFDDINEDEIVIDPNGQFRCEICNNRYSTEYILGTHFILQHNNYDELINLDTKNITVGFPGLDILKLIEMIDILDNNTLINIINNKEECNICYNKYNYNLLDYEWYKRKHMKTKCDIEIYKKSNNKNKINYIYDDNDIQLVNINIKDSRLKEIINKYNIEIKPVTLKCCNKYICSLCLERTLLNSYKMKCPYCFYDHCREDLDYIIIYEFDNINKESWINWWRKHLDIFY